MNSQSVREERPTRLTVRTIWELLFASRHGSSFLRGLACCSRFCYSSPSIGRRRRRGPNVWETGTSASRVELYRPAGISEGPLRDRVESVPRIRSIGAGSCRGSTERRARRERRSRARGTGRLDSALARFDSPRLRSARFGTAQRTFVKNRVITLI